MEATKRSSDRRLGITRVFVPDAAFHWYIRAVGFGALGIVAFFGGLSWWYHGRLLKSLGLLEAAGDPMVERVIADYTASSIVVSVVASIGIVLFVTLLSLYLLHRISGPVYRLKQHMLGIMMGRPAAAVNFRKDDQLSDLSATFNELLYHLGAIERQAQPSTAPSEAEEAGESHAGAEA
jgi:hypothetical protein